MMETRLDDNQYDYPQLQLPNATAVLILGILSILTCCCYGLLGLTFGIIAVVLASKDQKLYKANPVMYTVGSFSNLKAGQVCGIIGIVLSVLFICYLLFLAAMFGTGVFGNPEAMKEALESMQR